MTATWPAAIAVATMVLSGCESTQIVDQARPAASTQIAAADLPAPPETRPASHPDVMRAALPEFELRTGRLNDQNRQEVSVIRDLAFNNNGFLTRDDIVQIAILQKYLRANPAVVVRVEGHGDGPKRTEDNATLSVERAESVKRALLTDTRLTNTIVAEGGAVSANPNPGQRAEVILVMP